MLVTVSLSEGNIDDWTSRLEDNVLDLTVSVLLTTEIFADGVTGDGATSTLSDAL